MTTYVILGIVAIVCFIAKIWIDMQQRDELRKINEQLQKKP